jgi:hypothetical protein
VGDDLERYKLCEGHFRDWLHSGLTGCRFASTFATEKPVRIDFYSPLSPIDHEQIAAFIDATASHEITAVLLFPALRTARDTVNVLSVLTRGARWRLTRAGWPKGYRKPDSIALGLEWRIKTGEVSGQPHLAPPRFSQIALGFEHTGIYERDHSAYIQSDACLVRGRGTAGLEGV